MKKNINALYGTIEIICGSMFSGKTEELLRRLKRAQIAKQNMALFKPKMDNRFAELQVVSHDKNTLPAMPISDANEIISYIKINHSVKVVGIDEAQFFNLTIIKVVETLANQGLRIIIAGLDMDYNREPFAAMPQLLAKATFITKLQAICTECGKPASYSFRIVKNNQQILLGSQDEYKPLCRNCFNVYSK